ncbi:tripartite tricarboxylate transporter substrate-binding protein [Rhodopseudomonas sp. BR0G17]|uniref:tripartite tricarboxylate transporter substrate-binding protein n=1 Tax=Rhodopseudomonas sp. BR0G17 TaxID=2269368 RepID=UPI0013DF4EBA|nr:tripartite tricarboxylate transporter substrate-binding protein [Rhodopseudomonas sp. BR0G17]NEW97033.1 tripartite tricarboxylate transporter substrate binding protein BugD [Rhodopseudomonas sp. BR0G17]
MNLFDGASAARCAAIALMALWVSPAAAAEPDRLDQIDFPVRTVTVVVPFARGGPTDTVTRLITAEMAKTLGQPIEIENMLGAGGTLAATRVAHAAPDGHTLIVGHLGTHGAAVALFPKLAYRPDKDFSPVALLTEMPVLLLARKQFPPKDLSEFASYVKSHTDNLNVAHAGFGSVSYASCLLLNRLLKVDPTGVPFSGTGPALQALAEGQVDYMCDQIVNAVPALREGKVKAYVIASSERDPVVPDIPTAREAGLPGFQVGAWTGLFAPRGTPEPIVAKINAAVSRALDQSDVRTRLTDLGALVPRPEQRAPVVLAQLVQDEINRWEEVVKGNIP